MKKLLLVLSLFLMIFGATGIASADNLITNGDFSTGDLTGWNSWGDGVSVYNEIAFLDLNNSVGLEGIQQFFYLEAGTIGVNISFDYLFAEIDNAFLYTDLFTSSFVFLITEFPGFELNNLVAETSTNLVHFEAYYEINDLYDFNPNASIQFNLTEACGFFNDKTDSWVALDNVIVEGVSPVPEPTTMLLVGSGLIGFAGLRRKFKK